MSDRSTTSFDFEGSAWYIENHAALMQWIELARRLVRDIQNCAGLDKELDAQLREHDIRYNLDWNERESAGLYQLTEDVAQAAQRAIAAARGVSHD